MSSTPFLIYNIESSGDLPSEVVVNLPGWLIDLGYEDFEPEDDEEFVDASDGRVAAEAHVDDEDEHEDGADEEDDGEDYEPSEIAVAALEAEWDSVIREMLTRQFGAVVHKIGGYRPA